MLAGPKYKQPNIGGSLYSPIHISFVGECRGNFKEEILAALGWPNCYD